ncbi:hypothetical protein [Actinoplanes sp. DH11]|uniref:hypothetical protein n=1 Tax=Actinoplanes sp. DH11 TaxID=2857011 RepID=UPI001E31833B|nr:hypothetical protein [Actinoplanes sp. DH11]
MTHDVPDEAGQSDPLVDVAAEVLRAHVPERGGWCVHCRLAWGRWVWFPCEPVRWAQAVLDQFGGSGTGPEPGEQQR